VSENGFVAVVNFDRFQHYKDRNPPWIKLHAALLDDYEFGRLQDASKMHLVGIWILASKTENKVPADPEWIAKRIGARAKVDLEVLIAAGFLVRLRRASDTLAEREQDARPVEESRGEAESEAEERKPTGVSLAVIGSVKPAKAKNLETIQTRLAAVLADVVGDGLRRVGAAEMRQVQAELVFSYWAAKLDHPKALLDAERERRLVKRLEENGGDVHELLYVVDGARKDEWTMGTAKGSTKKFDGIETIYQDRAHVEKFASMCPAYKNGDPHPMAVKYLSTAEVA
jgi:hypothetical protein